MKAVRLGKWSERPDDLFQLMAKYAYLPDVKVSSVVFLVAVTNALHFRSRLGRYCGKKLQSFYHQSFSTQMFGWLNVIFHILGRP